NMRDNDWLIYAPFDELECPPSANSLEFKVMSHDVWITLRFSQRAKSELYEKIKSLLKEVYQDIKEQMRRIWPKNDWTERILNSMEFKEEQAKRMFESINEKIKEDPITLCTLEGYLIWPTNISMYKTYTVLPGQNIIAGSLMVNVGIGIEIA
ncbi:MAG: hypothetical protein AB1478_10565, partial [Nitrospirota bacterium]